MDETDTHYSLEIFWRTFPKNYMQILSEAINGKIEADRIIHPNYPTKYIHAGYYPGLKWRPNYMKLYLKTYKAPAWTADEINKLKTAIESNGIYIVDPFMFNTITYPSLIDNITRSVIISDIFPLQINAIIYGYIIFDEKSSSYFPIDVVRMFKQMYFRMQNIYIHPGELIIQDGPKRCIMDSEKTEISLDFIRYVYNHKNDEILVVDSRTSISPSGTYKNNKFKPSTYNKNARPPKPHEIPKLSIDVINHFDPNKEWGLMDIFAPLISQESYVKVLNDLSHVKYAKEIELTIEDIIN